MDPDRNYQESGPSDGSGWPAEGRYSAAGHYGGESHYPAGEGRYAGGESRYSAPGSPVPEARRVEHADPPPTRATVGPRSGLPIPEERPRRAAVPPGSPAPAGETYRSRRPAAAAVLGVAAGLLEIPCLLLLLDNATGGAPSAVVASVCLVLALPLLAMGLYAVATNAVRAAGPNSAQAWLRPPVAYLSVALVLIVAAGLAA